MRTAIVSDIHGNGTAFEAILADLKETAPDLIVHAGDLADGGSSPVEIVDRIRALGWPGIGGNTDEMLFRPASVTEFARSLPQFAAMFAAIEESAAFTREKLGEERIAWLRALPDDFVGERFALVHARPGDRWRAPRKDASDAELEAMYAPLGQPVAVYGHIHTPFIRRMENVTVANSGSAGLPHDGDRRASYLLLDDGEPAIRRVEYDLAREVRALHASGLPHAAWVARTLEAAAFQML